jgi:hypothetical protein
MLLYVARWAQGFAVVGGSASFVLFWRFVVPLPLVWGSGFS